MTPLLQHFYTVIEKMFAFLFPQNNLELTLRQTDIIDLLAKNLTEEDNLEEKFYAALNYKASLVRTLIWSLKYRGDQHAAKLGALFLNEIITEIIAEKRIFNQYEEFVVVPIPLAKKRQKERGFNQMTLVGKYLTIKDSNSLYTIRNNVLYKTKSTKSQTLIKDKNHRKLNLAGCFTVKDRSIIHNKTVIIIDDVITTGSTFREARDTLLKAGAREVFCVAIAH